jgi:hypothetical protein
MATFAGHRFVRPLQLEIGEFVAECLTIERHNVGATPLVVGVAVFTFGTHHIRTQTMKAMFLLTVGGNILMTCRAEPGL